MKQPSHLAKSRHGVFYFRLTFRAGSAIKEKRISLKTKNPQEARFKSSCLSAIMLTRQQEWQKAICTVQQQKKVVRRSMSLPLQH